MRWSSAGPHRSVLLPGSCMPRSSYQSSPPPASGHGAPNISSGGRSRSVWHNARMCGAIGYTHWIRVCLPQHNASCLGFPMVFSGPAICLSGQGQLRMLHSLHGNCRQTRLLDASSGCPEVFEPMELFPHQDHFVQLDSFDQERLQRLEASACTVLWEVGMGQGSERQSHQGKTPARQTRCGIKGRFSAFPRPYFDISDILLLACHTHFHPKTQLHDSSSTRLPTFQCSVQGHVVNLGWCHSREEVTQDAWVGMGAQVRAVMCWPAGEACACR